MKEILYLPNEVKIEKVIKMGHKFLLSIMEEQNNNLL